MARIIIRGRAEVFGDGGRITAPAVLQTIDGIVYDDERFTDYLGSSPAEVTLLASALESGGILQFSYRWGDPFLTVVTEYQSRRPFSAAELRLLVYETLGQWSDGIGENWCSVSQERCGFQIVCLTRGDDVGEDYPEVRVIEDPNEG